MSHGTFEAKLAAPEAPTIPDHGCTADRCYWEGVGSRAAADHEKTEHNGEHTVWAI